ncbi:AR6P4-like protein [Mya arenaria]|uniref:ADP-ribosylation factor-like protein 6-interacting protein 4 n=2 Tax=Mya arenaria TaxID=6604 RepID=A0ABY7E9F1_MYAAR|nr:ADP-ribosylation factor-like protein 6-interacting protein 4 isoform X2 [Mya arenaria]WAR03776.1 AR6P4-like protein [Mya arenaria]
MNEKRNKKIQISESDIGPVLPTTSTQTPKADDLPGEGNKARAKAMRPMTKEEWEKKQSTIRHMYDPETGRNRLVRGDGEILEEIVSKDRHRDINKQATHGDGTFYAMKMGILDK